MRIIYETLKSRKEQLRGSKAQPDEVARLAQLLQSSEWAPLVRIYEELPICGCLFSFVVDEHGVASAPGAHFMDDYDSRWEHEVVWISPPQIMSEIEESYAGPSAFMAGFVPIGESAMGGDAYFLRVGLQAQAWPALYRVYYDWINPAAEVPVPPQALHVVAESFASVIEVARIERG